MPSNRPYALGVDLGTTFTAAAVDADARRVLELGNRGASIPSAIYRLPDGSTLVGDAAVQRGLSDPAGLAREFKRRFGDDTPLILGGVPVPVPAAMQALLESVLATATERMGGAPASAALTHPAAWGGHRLDGLRAVARAAGLADPILVPEPVAAAVHYTTLDRLAPGEHVLVYDLGGGTFDATVVRRAAEGFEIVGEPTGLDQAGGADMDHAVLSHIRALLDADLGGMDREDPGVRSGLERLRSDAVHAKEMLSADTDTTIAVAVGAVGRNVRLTRAELEELVEPALRSTLECSQHAVDNAGIQPADLSRILLVGGASRMPLVSELVRSHFADSGAPVVSDVHPKHACALGAAAMAGRPLSSTRPTIGLPDLEPEPDPDGVRRWVVALAVLLVVAGILGAVLIAGT